MPAKNGYVPTSGPVADYAAAAAFGATRPSEIDNGQMLFPSLGTGNLYDALGGTARKVRAGTFPSSTMSSRTASVSRTTRTGFKSSTSSTLTRPSTSQSRISC